MNAFNKEIGTFIHTLKTWPEFYEAVAYGGKTFEVRRNDRDFKVGDFLNLVEWNHETDVPTGRSMLRRVTYILKGGQFGIEDDYVVMGLSDRM